MLSWCKNNKIFIDIALKGSRIGSLRNYNGLLLPQYYSAARADFSLLDTMKPSEIVWFLGFASKTRDESLPAITEACKPFLLNFLRKSQMNATDLVRLLQFFAYYPQLTQGKQSFDNVIIHEILRQISLKCSDLNSYHLSRIIYSYTKAKLNAPSFLDLIMSEIVEKLQVMKPYHLVGILQALHPLSLTKSNEGGQVVDCQVISLLKKTIMPHMMKLHASDVTFLVNLSAHPSIQPEVRVISLANSFVQQRCSNAIGAVASQNTASSSLSQESSYESNVSVEKTLDDSLSAIELQEFTPSKNPRLNGISEKQNQIKHKTSEESAHNCEDTEKTFNHNAVLNPKWIVMPFSSLAIRDGLLKPSTLIKTLQCLRALPLSAVPFLSSRKNNKLPIQEPNPTTEMDEFQLLRYSEVLIPLKLSELCLRLKQPNLLSSLKKPSKYVLDSIQEAPIPSLPSHSSSSSSFIHLALKPTVPSFSPSATILLAEEILQKTCISVKLPLYPTVLNSVLPVSLCCPHSRIVFLVGGSSTNYPLWQSTGFQEWIDLRKELLTVQGWKVCLINADSVIEAAGSLSRSNSVNASPSSFKIDNWKVRLLLKRTIINTFANGKEVWKNIKDGEPVKGDLEEMLISSSVLDDLLESNQMNDDASLLLFLSNKSNLKDCKKKI